MTSPPLPKMPEHEDYAYNVIGDMTYERARADAWEARARLMRPHMRHTMICDMSRDLGGSSCTCGLNDALKLIGELPSA